MGPVQYLFGRYSFFYLGLQEGSSYMRETDATCQIGLLAWSLDVLNCGSRFAAIRIATGSRRFQTARPKTVRIAVKA